MMISGVRFRAPQFSIKPPRQTEGKEGARHGVKAGGLASQQRSQAPTSQQERMFFPGPQCPKVLTIVFV